MKRRQPKRTFTLAALLVSSPALGKDTSYAIVLKDGALTSVQCTSCRAFFGSPASF